MMEHLSRILCGIALTFLAIGCQSSSSGGKSGDKSTGHMKVEGDENQIMKHGEGKKPAGSKEDQAAYKNAEAIGSPNMITCYVNWDSAVGWYCHRGGCSSPAWMCTNPHYLGDGTRVWVAYCY